MICANIDILFIMTRSLSIFNKTHKHRHRPLDDLFASVRPCCYVVCVSVCLPILVIARMMVSWYLSLILGPHYYRYRYEIKRLIKDFTKLMNFLMQSKFKVNAIYYISMHPVYDLAIFQV